MKFPILGGLKKGLVFIVSAPAGTGKTTLVRMLTNEFPCVIECVSYTTRKPRSGELEGRDYYFITRDEFAKKLAGGEFIEYAEVFGSYYGTSREFIESQQALGKHVILVIDTQGAMQLKSVIEATFIFVSPPNIEELRARLHRRKSESLEAMEQRLSWAEKEMMLADKYDYHIINENLETAYTVLRAILIAEEHKNR